jgi:hypothetical protein
MSKLVYFVVTVDLESKEVSIDDDTLVARFPDGSVWDDVSGKWESEIRVSDLAEATSILKGGF